MDLNTSRTTQIYFDRNEVRIKCYYATSAEAVLDSYFQFGAILLFLL